MGFSGVSTLTLPHTLFWLYPKYLDGQNMNNRQDRRKLEPRALTQIRTPPWCSFVGKHLETTQMSNFYRLSQYKMIRFNHIKRIPSSCRISHPSSTISILGIWTSPAQKPWCGHGNWVGLDDPSGPAERTPKKPEYLIARSQLPEQGPLGFGPIQFLMDGWFLEQIITLPEN